MRRWLIVALLSFVLAGCAWAQRRTEPGPDGVLGTEDDVVVESQIEEGAARISGLAEKIGYGWVGLAMQGLATAISIAATGTKGTRPA